MRGARGFFAGASATAGAGGVRRSVGVGRAGVAAGLRRRRPLLRGRVRRSPWPPWRPSMRPACGSPSASGPRVGVGGGRLRRPGRGRLAGRAFGFGASAWVEPSAVTSGAPSPPPSATRRGLLAICAMSCASSSGGTSLHSSVPRRGAGAWPPPLLLPPLPAGRGPRSYERSWRAPAAGVAAAHVGVAVDPAAATTSAISLARDGRLVGGRGRRVPRRRRCGPARAAPLFGDQVLGDLGLVEVLVVRDGLEGAGRGRAVRPSRAANPRPSRTGSTAGPAGPPRCPRAPRPRCRARAARCRRRSTARRPRPTRPRHDHDRDHDHDRRGGGAAGCRRRRRRSTRREAPRPRRRRRG